MISRMSIKMKLISSFSLIVFLIVILSFYSDSSVSKSSRGFISYQKMSEQNDLIKSIDERMLKINIIVKEYLKNENKDHINTFRNHHSIVKSSIKKFKSSDLDKNTSNNIMEIEALLNKYNENFLKIVKLKDQKKKIIHDSFINIGPKILKKFESLKINIKNENKISISEKISNCLSDLQEARYFLVRTTYENINFYKNVKTLFNKYNNELIEIQANLSETKNKNNMNQIISYSNKYINGVERIYKILIKMETIQNTIINIEKNINKKTKKIFVSVKAKKLEVKKEVLSLNAHIKTFIDVISISILVIVVILAVFLPKHINYLLKTFEIGLLNFFKYINKESDNVDLIKINGSNEIVSMSNVVNENIKNTKLIVEEDKKLIEDVKFVVQEVEKGNFKKRIKEKTNNVSLKELKDNFNNMLDITSKNICEDLNKINDILEFFSKLDFRKRVENDNGKVAIGLNKLADMINEMLVENKNNGLTLDKSSKVLLANVDILNKNSNEAAAALEQTAAALEEITSNISNNTNNVMKMSNYANDLSKKAEEGEDLAVDTTKSMDEINEQVLSINEAITVVDQIAFQTNILSLNAAVEAATAGEAGKGFSVVAQEVRNLASRSAEAAKEIKNLVENATLKANDGKNIANKMKDGYEDLRNNISDTLKIIENVEMASKEQQTGIEQINDAVNSLDQQTQENASIAIETNSIAEETDQIAKIILDKADEKEFQGKEKISVQKVTKVDNKTKYNKKEVNLNTKNNKVEKIKTEIKASNTNELDEWETF